MVEEDFSEVEKKLIEAGYPPSLFLTPAQRKAAWDANPPKPMPAFSAVKKSSDQETLKLLAAAEAEKIKVKKTDNKREQIDRTGQRWDPRKTQWVNDTAASQGKAMISLTTNTRGATKMTTKDYADMSLMELANAYNKISGKDPIKKFKDKATGLKRMAELQTAKFAAKKESTGPLTGRPLSEIVRKPKPATKEGSANKLAAEFNARVGSFREKLLIALDDHYKKMVSEAELLKAVYGSKNTENAGALTMVVKGAQTTIEKNKLPYTLKKEKNEAKEISYGLFPK